MTVPDQEDLWELKIAALGAGAVCVVPHRSAELRDAGNHVHKSRLLLELLAESWLARGDRDRDRDRDASQVRVHMQPSAG